MSSPRKLYLLALLFLPTLLPAQNFIDRTGDHSWDTLSNWQDNTFPGLEAIFMNKDAARLVIGTGENRTIQDLRLANDDGIKTYVDVTGGTVTGSDLEIGFGNNNDYNEGYYTQTGGTVTFRDLLIPQSNASATQVVKGVLKLYGGTLEATRDVLMGDGGTGGFSTLDAAK